ncbi:hypothetical protein ACFL09_04570 [Planctomycetota bacterium]
METEHIVSHFDGVQRISDSEWRAICPIHNDTDPSLHFTRKPNGDTLFHCFGGCPPEDVLRKKGLAISDLYRDGGEPPKPKRKSRLRQRPGGLTLNAFSKAKRLPKKFLEQQGVEQVHALKLDTDGAKTVIVEHCDEDKQKELRQSKGKWWWEVVFRYTLEDGSDAPRHRRRFALKGESRFAWTGTKDDGPLVPYGLRRLPSAREEGYLIFVEGESDALTLWFHGYQALAFPGASTPKKLLKLSYVKGIGRVFIFKEPGSGGETFVRDIAKRLRGFKSWRGKILVVTLDGAKDPSELHCQDPEQFRSRFQAARDAAKEVDVEAQAQERPAELDSRLPRICLDSMTLGSLTEEVVAALQKANDPPVLFVRGGKLCRVAWDEKGRAKIQLVDKQKLCLQIATSAQFTVETTDFIKLVAPPNNLIECVLSLPKWPFPGLEALSTAPILRSDGTICQEAGYDRDTRTCYFPDPDLEIPPIPEKPTSEQVKEAVEALLDPIAEFPFDSDASRANALAFLFSVLMRSVVKGHVPLCIFTAPVQGTGKTWLAEIFGIIAVGNLAMQTAPERQNEDEWRKRITALLLDGSEIALLDNFRETAVLQSANLAAVITTDEWKDRRLGKSELLILPARVVWAVTGNNVRVGGDIPRRSYTVRLDANMETPSKRTGFRLSDVRGYVRQNRGHLLAAAFTMIRSWYQARKPKATGVPAFGGFEQWAETIGGVLAHAGIEGFLGNLDELRTVQDDEAMQWRAFFGAWWQQFQGQPTTVADLCDKLFGFDSLSLLPGDLPDALSAAKDKGDNSLRRSMGKNLSRLAGRIFEGHKLRPAGKDGSSKSRRWRLEEISSYGVNGVNGVSSLPPVAGNQIHDTSRTHIEVGAKNPVNPSNPVEAVPACVRKRGHADLWRLKSRGPWTCVICKPPGSQFLPTQIEHGRWDSETGQVALAHAETADNDQGERGTS